MITGIKKGSSAQEVLDDLIAIRDNIRQIIIIVENDDGEMILRQSLMKLSSQTHMIECAKVWNNKLIAGSFASSQK